jgi:hypothetical protein
MACALLLSDVVFIVPLLRTHPLPSDCCVVLVTRHVMFTARVGHIVCSVTLYCCLVAIEIVVNNVILPPLQHAHHNIFGT